MTFSEFIKKGELTLTPLYGPLEAKAIAMRLVQDLLSVTKTELLLNLSASLSHEKRELLERALEELATAKPLQYVVGWEEFMGYKIKVGEGVLIPRPETWELVRIVIDHLAGEESFKALDAACGSGCISIALAKEFPSAKIFGCDLSSKALEYSAINKELNRCSNLELFECDLLSGDASLKIIEKSGGVNLIVSNPPYITNKERELMHANVLEHEPVEALFVPDNDPLLFYKALQQIASDVLLTGGAIFMEVNEAYAQECSQLFVTRGFTKSWVMNDFNNKPRFVIAIK